MPIDISDSHAIKKSIIFSIETCSNGRHVQQNKHRDVYWKLLASFSNLFVDFFLKFIRRRVFLEGQTWRKSAISREINNFSQWNDWFKNTLIVWLASACTSESFVSLFCIHFSESISICMHMLSIQPASHTLTTWLSKFTIKSLDYRNVFKWPI